MYIENGSIKNKVKIKSEKIKRKSLKLTNLRK